MSDEVTFLIHKAPKPFMDIVFTDDQNVRFKKLNSSLARIRRTRDSSPAALMGALPDDESRTDNFGGEIPLIAPDASHIAGSQLLGPYERPPV
jgi:hypothetical protein